LKDPGIGGRLVLKWILERLDGGIDWILLAQYGDIWRDLVNAVINLQDPYNAGNFLSSSGRVSFSGRTLPQGVNYVRLVMAHERFQNL
jgi:hypothetical protein